MLLILFTNYNVIPAKAVIQLFQWIPYQVRDDVTEIAAQFCDVTSSFSLSRFSPNQIYFLLIPAMLQKNVVILSPELGFG